MNKKLFVVEFLIVISLVLISCDQNVAPTEHQTSNTTLLEKKVQDVCGCTTIQSGELVTSDGTVIKTGFMENGYNYQAHLYKGEYSPGWNLVMKWNDAWLSNKDCDGDGKLDRHLGYDSYKGSGAWCTNHWTTTYTNEDGNECNYVDFIKIAAVPEDANKVDGIWYNAAGVEIGPDIWGQFAIIQEVINDPCEGIHGIQYGSPDHKGLGNW